MGHTPNHITKEERTQCLIFALFLITYGTVGFIFDDIYIPGKRGRGIHLHGVSCALMYSAFLMGACNLVSVVVDHYDKRNNETNYQRFAKITRLTGWILFVAAMLYSFYELIWN